VKLGKQTAPFLNPTCRDALHFFDEIRDAKCARQSGQQMHMICHATDLNGQTIQRLGAAAKISMDLGTEGRVLKSRFSAFGREDSVNDHAGERLWHGGSQGFMRDGHNPVGVEPNGVCFDRVSQGSANPGLVAARPSVLKSLETLGMGMKDEMRMANAE